MARIGIILGTTRPGRVGPQVAQWIEKTARAREDADFELVDLADYDLPLFDEPRSPLTGVYAHAHTRAWSARIAELDGFVFVTPEYNRSIPSALKNAIERFTTFTPAERHDAALQQMLTEVIAWTNALEPLRHGS